LQEFFWDTDGLLITDYLHPGNTTTGQYHAAETATKVVTYDFDFFMKMHQRTSHWLLSKLSATVNLFNQTILPTVQTWLSVIIS